MTEERQAFSERLAQVFRQETAMRLERMRDSLREIESQGSPIATGPRLMPLQLEVHSLKGAARSVERRDIEMLCQDAELLLIKARDSAISKESLSGVYQLIAYLDQVVVQSSTIPMEATLRALQATLRASAMALNA